MLYATTTGLSKLIFCQNSPEDLPYSPSALVGVLVLSALWQFLGIFGQLGILNALLWALTPLALMAAFLGLTLQIRGQTERFLKIFLGLQGSNLLIEMIIWLIAPLIPYRTALVLVGGLWQLTVMGHILQYGLGLSRFKAALLSLLYIMGLGLVMMPAVIALNAGVAGAA